MKAWAIGIVVLFALAGCSDEPKVSKVGSHTHGNYHVCPDGTELDPASFPDHHEDGFDVADKCPAEGQAAAAFISLDGADGVAYEEMDFSWEAVPGGGADRVAETGVHVATTNSAPTSPSSGGTRAASETAADAPRQYKGDFTPEAPGTYYLRAYVQVEAGGPYIWSAPAELTVTETPLTGTVETVTIQLDPLAPDVDRTSLDLVAGDAIRFVNNDIRAHSLATTEAPQAFETGTIAPNGGTSQDIPLFRLGTYTVTDGGEMSLEITVRAP